MTGVIEPKENGPLLVKNVQSLTNSKGADILPDKEVIALCRCGKSNNKPFCDGTHSKIGFSSATDNPKAGKWQDYVGEHITIHDNRRLCAHAGKCTNGLPGVWGMGGEPWIDPDGADVEAIIAVIEQCPSGALSYSIEGKQADAKAPTDGVFVSMDGPYHVSGAITLNDPSRDADDVPSRYALCRCGASKNKPFCDGSHWEIKFEDDNN
ncbi:MAG: CDGSH iron-sulfur domain-containing protein [Gammaproteobacteria bacterium]|nr:CDGSH iron-sulfur domain-containing protein [Gammaproteobacteria bacterium]MDH3466931.1 CDGSH iron-sulfur domain-containing protein [Gammaproteobacteria bacterium]